MLAWPKTSCLCSRPCASANAPPYAVIGTATEEKHLTLSDDHFDNQPIDLPLDVLLGKAPKMHRDVQSLPAQGKALQLDGITRATPPSACCVCRPWRRSPSSSPSAIVP